MSAAEKDTVEFANLLRRMTDEQFSKFCSALEDELLQDRLIEQESMWCKGPASTGPAPSC